MWVDGGIGVVLGGEKIYRYAGKVRNPAHPRESRSGEVVLSNSAKRVVTLCK